MKQSWIGLGILILLLGSSLLVTWTMDRLHTPVAENLDQAAECALLGDWVNADRFFRQARQGWEKWKGLRSCFADHTPLEEIQCAFDLLAVYGLFQEDAAFSAECRAQARRVEAVGEAHGLNWWNVL